MNYLGKLGLTMCIAGVLTGCGNSAAVDTAEAMTAAMFKQSARNDHELAALMEMPEYQKAVDCFANHLEQSGWDDDQHDFFMEQTDGTGNIFKIDRHKFTQEEQLEHFGPIFTNPCV